MTSYTECIGKRVLSSDFGIGKVVGVDEFGGTDKKFFVVEHQEKNARSYVPVEGEKSYRFISTKDELNKLIDSINTKPADLDFESKKDRINYFKDHSRSQSIDQTIKLLIELSSVDDRGKVEDQILTRVIDSLALEYSIVMGSTLEESKSLIKKKVAQA